MWKKLQWLFLRNEITTLHTDIAGSINAQAGREVVRFKPYQLDEGQAAE